MVITETKRELTKWHPNRSRVGEYRRDGTGAHLKRAKIVVDGREGGFYGIGSTFEEADAALRTFTNPQCVCFPGERNICTVHPEVKTRKIYEGEVLECQFTGFDPNVERWSSSGEKEDGTVDIEVIETFGYKSS